MLGIDIAPILLFTLKPDEGDAVANIISGIPLIGQSIVDNIGIPIPIYLDARLTGIDVESEAKDMSVDTDTEVLWENTKEGIRPKVTNSQKLLRSVLTVTMIANKDSIGLSILIALSELILKKLITKSYGITYLNGPMMIFNGLLHDFSVNQGIDDDLMRISITIGTGDTNKFQGSLSIPLTEGVPQISGTLKAQPLLPGVPR